MTKKIINKIKTINVQKGGNLTIGADVLARRKTLLQKIERGKRLGKPKKKDVRKRPKDLPLGSLTHQSHMCVATWHYGAGWVHDPMVKFERKTRTHFGKRYYKDVIRFNDMAMRRAGFIRPGMQLAVYTDKPDDTAKYVVFQNVVRRFDAPAHLHKLGTFTVIGRFRKHILRPETCGSDGYIGMKEWTDTPMVLLSNVPKVRNRLLRLWRVKGEDDLLIGYLDELVEVPRSVVTKLTRHGRMVESDQRPTREADYTLPSMSAARN